MNWLDVVIIILLAIAAISGFVSGLIKAVFSLAGLILGIFLAGHYYVALSDHLTFISNQNAARIIAYIIILLAVLIIAGILGAFLTRIVSNIALGWLNRLGGAFFSAVLSAIFITALLAIWVKYAGGGNTVSGSFLATILVDRLPLVLALLPTEFNSVHQFFR